MVTNGFDRMIDKEWNDLASFFLTIKHMCESIACYFMASIEHLQLEPLAKIIAVFMGNMLLFALLYVWNIRIAFHKNSILTGYSLYYKW